jgi:hypothetical protein
MLTVNGSDQRLLNELVYDRFCICCLEFGAQSRSHDKVRQVGPKSSHCEHSIDREAEDEEALGNVHWHAISICKQGATMQGDHDTGEDDGVVEKLWGSQTHKATCDSISVGAYSQVQWTHCSSR